MAFDIGAMLAGAGNFIESNPEKFAIAADMVGQNLDPNNTFAGVGQLFGASSLANKARQQQQMQIGDLLAQTPQAPTAPIAGLQPPAPQQSQGNFSLLKDMNLGAFSPAANPGMTSLTMQAQPDGSVVANPKFTLSGPVAQQQGQSVNLTDVLPLT